MSDRIRVRIVGPGHERTIGQDQYDAQPEAFEIVDKPAVDGGGVDIPAKYKTTVNKKAAASQVASPAPTTTPPTGDADKAAKSVDQNKEN